MEGWDDLPYVTAELPGTGGAIRVAPEDFEVEEIPAYEPAGAGPHLFLWVEKRGRNTRDVVRELARALGVPERELGVAGQKDKHALTRQYVSAPASAEARAAGLAGEGWRVVRHSRHGNKLKLGHLRGNRFRLRVRGAGPEAPERARAVARALAERGLPNAYGPQRFGRGGANIELGRALLGRGASAQLERARRDRFLRRMAISAYQSLLFNRVLAQRMRDGQFATAVMGDLMKKIGTGGLFVSKEPQVDGPRVARFEISPTGPMFGHRMMQPEDEAWERELSVLRAEGIELASFAPFKGDAEGSRRPMRLPVQVDVQAEGEDLLLAFGLEKGSYATAVLREVMKTSTAAPELAEDE